MGAAAGSQKRLAAALKQARYRLRQALTDYAKDLLPVTEIQDGSEAPRKQAGIRISGISVISPEALLAKRAGTRSGAGAA